jgi:hypothetical protein
MQRAGPMTRVPEKEKADKKQLDQFFIAWGNAWKSGDVSAGAAMVDFPVLMLTDDTAGKFSSASVGQDQWVRMMKPMLEKHQEHLAKRGHEGEKWSHKTTCYMLSDDLASCEGETSVGKVQGTLRSEMLMTRASSGWMVKSMVQAGWGDHQTTASNEAIKP